MHILLSVLILTLLFFTSCKNSNDYKWSELPEVTDISTLQQTEFVPTLQSPITENKNAVYATAFLYAWDKIKHQLNAPIALTDKNSNEFKLVNQSISYKNTLTDDEYSAEGDIIDRVITARAFFNKTLPFPSKLQKLDVPIMFNKTKVSGFGIQSYDEEAAKFTEILYYKDDDHFILKLTPKDNHGEPVPANVSLLVFNKSRQGQMLDFRQNILSYFLLSSDLKGEIEDPGFYFAKDADRFNDLDALLLTQGWRKYNYARRTITFPFQPEANLAVTGNVRGGLSDKKIIKGAGLTMMTFGKQPQVGQQKTDSLGRFNFPLNDDYEQSLNVVIQSANKSNKQANYLITLDKKESPPISFNHIRSVEKPDSIIKAYIIQNLANKKTQDSFKIASEGVVLQEVVVKTRRLSPQQKLVTEKYGEPDVIIDGKVIQAKEAKWSYGLYSVLMFNFPDKVKVTRYGNGMLYASLHNSEPTLVVIDGIPVKSYEYNLIPDIPPGEVKSFELIEYANNFHSLFCEAIYCGLNTPSVGNIISIYTYAGKGLYGVRPTIGLKKTEVPVFSPTREFYAPKYDQLKSEDVLKPDLRNLVHWQPDINTDSTGHATTSFYNSDNIGKIEVVVEAFSQNGEIGYQEIFFDVRKRN